MATNIPVLDEVTEGKIATVVADDLEIRGTIKFKSSVMLKGVFEGEIQSEGLLVVGPTAKVMATITTKTLISHGAITGNVTADEQVVLKGTAAHDGDVKAPFITIESGAAFNGAAIMARRQEVEASVETQGEEPVVAHEPVMYEPPVIPIIEERTEPFSMGRYDQRKKQLKDKAISEDQEGAAKNMDSTENAGI